MATMADEPQLKEDKIDHRQIEESIGGATMEQRADAVIDLTKRLLEAAERHETSGDRFVQGQVMRMMEDPMGKAFTTALTDQCFRSNDTKRVADQINYLLRHYGVPRFVPWINRLQLRCFMLLSPLLPDVLVPLAKKMLRLETNRYIWPADERRMRRRINRRLQRGVRVNINHLGEAILGEEEAENRLQTYLNDLKKPEVEYISVKISTIYSQLNLLAYEETIEQLAERLRTLYRAAGKHRFVQKNGFSVPKFVNLDMEEYVDLHLTVDVFKKVLSEPEFKQYSAGIVLQAYIPETYSLLQSLTKWAQERVNEGGVPVKVRLVKGANLAMERVVSAQHDWPQAPYTSKVKTDASFRRALFYALQKENIRAVHIGVGSHNLFDVALGLLLQAERGLGEGVEFEMLEGMANPMRKAVQEIAGQILLYCPTADEREFQNAIAYLIRRLDENTGPENFLRHIFGIKPDTPEWDEQVALFRESLQLIDSVSSEPRRNQDRRQPTSRPDISGIFLNEADTDWASPSNRGWIRTIADQSRELDIESIPLVINGKEIIENRLQLNVGDPSDPMHTRATHLLATEEDVDDAARCAEEAFREWSKVSVDERIELLGVLAQTLRERRQELITVMMASCGKIAEEADIEYSEAIDFVEYYRYYERGLQKMGDLEWAARGPVVVAPPWNFPASIPVGGIAAALVTGNTVLFKPAPEAVQVAWHIAQACWDSGISQQVLQFITCEDEPVGSRLVKDSRVKTLILTGAASTARKLQMMRPDLPIYAETGGKNTLIVTALADRDLAAGDIVRSAFGHAGQKCSACSLLILEEEVYKDPHFRRQLRDAAASLPVGPAWDLRTKVGPLIRPPGDELLRGLTRLEEGEEWLLQPRQINGNPQLWSPGIKLGVQPDSFTHKTELFGPVLGVMCAKDLREALKLANDTPYGLTAGLHSLDQREQERWAEQIEVGNLYMNNGITGAVVNRQPFGGCKDSAFGGGHKAGGPNYLFNFLTAKQVGLPSHESVPDGRVQKLSHWVEQQLDSETDRTVWTASIGSYAYWWKHHFSRKRDPNRLIGQDNFSYYKAWPISLRVQSGDQALDVYRACAAALTCGTPIEISASTHDLKQLFSEYESPVEEHLKLVAEEESAWLNRLKVEAAPHVRLLQMPQSQLQERLALCSARVASQEVLANGRVELLHYVREVSLSVNYHRYGNLGEREHEIRAALPQADE